MYQATCSPFRNPLGANERRKARAAASRPAWALARALARAAGAPDPEIRWRFLEGPYFDNQVASLTLDGGAADLRLEKTVPGEVEEHRLETTFERRLTAERPLAKTEDLARAR